MARTEVDERDLRNELERAEGKILALRELAANRKLRYERSQAEVERLQQTLPLRAHRLMRRAFRLEDRLVFCLFVGYPRSGHSLLGSLLDAHPDAAIAHGTNVLKEVSEKNVTGRELTDLLLRRAEADSDRVGGRRATGYSYAVPQQWQGQVRRLRVIGAKAGDKATPAIRRDPTALARLQRIMHARLRLLHVTRNPFDMVARMALVTKDGRPERTIAQATRFTGRLARINAKLIAERPHEVLTVRHESLVLHPHDELRRISSFLDIEPEEDWLSACSSVVFDRPQLTRQLVDWSQKEREGVAELIELYPFFAGYDWAS